MKLYALSYASRALVRGDEADAAVAEIVRVSRERNERLAVTGALLFSGGHFAQLLEGSRASVEELMASIRRDPRHTDLHIVQEGDIDRRAFASWSLAYSGPSRFIDGLIADALAGAAAGQPKHARLIRLFEEYSFEG